jgi:four helix bundle protein
MVAKRFEDLIFWQKSRELTKLIYSATRKSDFGKDFGLKEQIRRACVSVMSNVAEGFGRGGNSEFIQFLFVAKGSLSEVKSQLYVALDLNYIAGPEFKKSYEMTEEISRLINSFIKSLKSGAKRGLKTD